MTTRAITFPKTGDGEWTNTETGVRIRRGNQAETMYAVEVPERTWYVIEGLICYSLAEARAAAKTYVEQIARPALAKDHTEALAEDAEREADALSAAQGFTQIRESGFFRRAGEIAKGQRRGFLAAKQATLDEIHAEALAEDERRYLDEDEAWSVGAATWRSAQPVARAEESMFPDGAPVMTYDNGDQTYGPYGLTPEQVQAKTDAARAIADARVPESATSWHVGGKPTEPRPGDLVRITRASMHSTARRMQWKVVEFAADRKRVRVDLAGGSLLGPQWESWSDVALVSRPGVHAGSALPPVPDDVDDDRAWAAYCERLPEPTEAERLATAREHGPYADSRALAVEAFRSAVRSYRLQRAEQPTELGERVLASLRQSMRTSAETVRLYDQLTEAWLTGEGADSARDAFRQSF